MANLSIRGLDAYTAFMLGAAEVVDVVAHAHKLYLNPPCHCRSRRQLRADLRWPAPQGASRSRPAICGLRPVHWSTAPLC